MAAASASGTKRKVVADDAESSKRPTIAQAPAPTRLSYVSLTSHAGRSGINPVPVEWGATDGAVRGPVLCTSAQPSIRNAIGAHSGSYCIYKSLAVAAGALDRDFKPDLALTAPAVKIGPYPGWKNIASIDPYGHDVQRYFQEYLDKGYDVRPSIAVTRAHCDIMEVHDAMAKGRLAADGKVLMESGVCQVLKAAIEPVWYLPEIASRFGTSEAELRRTMFEESGGIYPELLTRPDLKVFLPPIGGCTIYMFGDHTTISDPKIPLTVRVHDECNGSDVFGSDICTCRVYLMHGIEECIKTAQAGGAGVIVYFRKEGRALGEVTKYLVYNRRKRQEGGDTAEKYFSSTECVAGIQDVRFQELMPDPLHWLGITHIHKLVSMSDMKYNAITKSGITIGERVPLPAELVPTDAAVEIAAKVFAGYEGGSVYNVTAEDLKKTQGRDFAESGAAAAGEGKE